MLLICRYTENFNALIFLRYCFSDEVFDKNNAIVGNETSQLPIRYLPKICYSYLTFLLSLKTLSDKTIHRYNSVNLSIWYLVRLKPLNKFYQVGMEILSSKYLEENAIIYTPKNCISDGIR